LGKGAAYKRIEESENVVVDVVRVMSIGIPGAEVVGDGERACAKVQEFESEEVVDYIVGVFVCPGGGKEMVGFVVELRRKGTAKVVQVEVTSE